MYHFGIIDFLQSWDKGKKAERCLKTSITKMQNDISAIPPDQYQKRFMEFIKKSIMKPAAYNFMGWKDDFIAEIMNDL